MRILPICSQYQKYQTRKPKNCTQNMSSYDIQRKTPQKEDAQLPLGFNSLYNISFCAYTNPNRIVGDVDLETYYLMTEHTKERYRRAYKNFSKNEAINKDELFDKKNPELPLKTDELLEKFLETSKIYLNYKNQPIICLGRSPKWFLNTAFWLKDGIPDYKFVAFSGYWYYKNNNNEAIKMKKEAPTQEEEKAYRKYLEKIGVTPQKIVETMQKEGKKTIITDYIYSGKGACSFLDILSRYAKDEGILEEFSKSIQIVGIGSLKYMEEMDDYSDTISCPIVPMPELLEPYANNIEQNFHNIDYEVFREILLNKNTNECRSTYYPHYAWTIYSPDTFKTGLFRDKDLIRTLAKDPKHSKYFEHFTPIMQDYRNLLNFRILDYLDSRNMLREPIKDLETTAF